MIPTSFEEWKNCIINDCKIKLTKEFAQKHLEVYENKSHHQTIKFAELYGQQHLENIIYWYRKVL